MNNLFVFNTDSEDKLVFDKYSGELSVSEDGSSEREITLTKRAAINLASVLLQYATAKKPE